MKLRHYLVMCSVALVVVGPPVVWLLSGDWPWVGFVLGLAFLLFGIALVLTPERIDLD